MFVKKKKKEKTNFYKIKMYIKMCGCFINDRVLTIEAFDICTLILISVKLGGLPS